MGTIWRKKLFAALLAAACAVCLPVGCSRNGGGGSSSANPETPLPMGKRIDPEKVLSRKTEVEGKFALYTVRFTPDGKSIYATTSGGGGLEVYDAASLERKYVIPNVGGAYSEISGDSRRMVLGAGPGFMLSMCRRRR